MLLADHLQQQGISQETFATLAGVSLNTVQCWIAYQRGRPNGKRPLADNIAKIARVTGGRVAAADWPERDTQGGAA